MKLRAFLLFFTVAALSSAASATDYCKPGLCRSGKHIACNPSQEFGQLCPADAKLVDINKSHQDMMVNVINEYRNFIAGGGHIRHSPACRMATIQWDNELAELAALLVKQCSLTHDECHNTDAFKYSGQNLAWSSSTGRLEIDAELKNGIKIWYDEVAYSDMSNIRKYPRHTYGNVIGHFTILMADKNIRVGCAASTYSEQGKRSKEFLLACNFATTNMIDHPIYKDCRRAASNCTTGTNPKYPNLCSTSEVYEVNNWF